LSPKGKVLDGFVEVLDGFVEVLDDFVEDFKIFGMEQMRGKGLKVKEPNTLIEAKQKMTREEMVIWLWGLVSAKIYSDKNGKPIPEDQIEEIKKNRETIYAVSWIDLNELAERFPDYFSERKLRYYRQIVKGLERKIVFEVNLHQYLKALEITGFGYLKKELGIPNPDDVYYYGIATVMSIALMKDGRLQIVFSPHIAPLLVSLKKWFTLYRFDEILSLKSKNSIILYRIVKEKLGLKQKSFTLSPEEIKLIFNLKKEIKVWDIRRKILKPAVEEINEKTSLKIEFEPIRKGRGGRIVAYKFEVEEVELSTADTYFASEKKILKWIKDLSLSIDGEKIPYERVVVELIEELERVNPAIALWFLLNYPSHLRENALKHINSIQRIYDENFMWLDRFTIKNLELIYPQFHSGIPLISVIDKTTSPMGARLLKKFEFHFTPKHAP